MNNLTANDPAKQGFAMPHGFSSPSPLVPANPLSDEAIDNEPPRWEPTIGTLASFFDATARYQHIRWSKLTGVVVEAYDGGVRLKLEDGRVTSYISRRHVFEPDEAERPALEQLAKEVA